MPNFFLGVDLIVFPAFFYNFKPHVIGLGVNENVQNTGEPMPIFFRCGLNCFTSIFL